MASSIQRDLSSRLALAGGGKALVEKVIGVLEKTLAAYKVDKSDFFDTESLESLEPDLSLLNDITVEMVESMKLLSRLCAHACAQVNLAFGRCKTHQQVLHEHQEMIQCLIARDQAAAADDLRKIRDLDVSIDECHRKVADVKRNLEKLAKFWWVPYYNSYLAVRAIGDAVEKRQSLLTDRLREAEGQREHAQADMRSEELLITELTKEKCALQKKMEALQLTEAHLIESMKLYSAKVETLSDAVVFYGLVRNSIKSVEDNLDLIETIKRLYENSTSVLDDREARPASLKEMLLHLGEDYDRFVEDGALGKSTSVDFNIEDTLDTGYLEDTGYLMRSRSLQPPLLPQGFGQGFAQAFAQGFPPGFRAGIAPCQDPGLIFRR